MVRGCGRGKLRFRILVRARLMHACSDSRAMVRARLVIGLGSRSGKLWLELGSLGLGNLGLGLGNLGLRVMELGFNLALGVRNLELVYESSQALGLVLEAGLGNLVLGCVFEQAFGTLIDISALNH